MGGKASFGADEYWLARDVHLWLCQGIVFLAKGAWSYVCGYPFAHIRSQFRLAPPSDAERGDREGTNETAFMAKRSVTSFATPDFEKQEIPSTPSSISTSSTDQTELEALRGKKVCSQSALAG